MIYNILYREFCTRDINSDFNTIVFTLFLYLSQTNAIHFISFIYSFILVLLTNLEKTRAENNWGNQKGIFEISLRLCSL